MVIISQSSFKMHGCPTCGCSYCNCPSVIEGVGKCTCLECKDIFMIAYNGYEKNMPHPRAGISSHVYVAPDIKPECGEYLQLRSIGYDLSGFVKSKIAGERILMMVKDILNKSEPKSWLDYREYEPDYIQFKFQKEEFMLDKLKNLVEKNNNIVTFDILKKCKI